MFLVGEVFIPKNFFSPKLNLQILAISLSASVHIAQSLNLSPCCSCLQQPATLVLQRTPLRASTQTRWLHLSLPEQGDSCPPHRLALACLGPNYRPYNLLQVEYFLKRQDLEPCWCSLQKRKMTNLTQKAKAWQLARWLDSPLFIVDSQHKKKS